MAEKRKKTWFTVWVQVVRTDLTNKVLGKTLILPQEMLHRTNFVRNTTIGHRVGARHAPYWAEPAARKHAWQRPNPNRRQRRFNLAGLDLTLIRASDTIPTGPGFRA